MTIEVSCCLVKVYYVTSTLRRLVVAHCSYDSDGKLISDLDIMTTDNTVCPGRKYGGPIAGHELAANCRNPAKGSDGTYNEKESSVLPLKHCCKNTCTV